MLTESDEIKLKIVPPVILNDDADVVAYSSIEELIRDVELVDVLNNEYEFHDSTGRVLEARVYKKQINLIPTAKVEAESPELRGYMVQALRLLGLEDEDLSGASFGKLARHLLEKSQEKK